jgi:hypothetical protein
MPFRIDSEGNIECDTAEEALDLQRRMFAAKKNRSVTASPLTKTLVADVANHATQQHEPFVPPADGGTNLDRFFHDMAESCQRILFALAEQPEGVGTDTLAQRVGLTARSLPPLLQAIHRLAAKHKIGISPVDRHEVADEYGRSKSQYILHDDLVKMIKKMTGSPVT